MNMQNIITTLAGTGIWGSSGDGGAATSAQLAGPYGVTVDISGNVYIADSMNNKIRMVTSTGFIATIAGTGEQGDSGDGGAATSAQFNYPSGVSVDISGNLYIADQNNQKIRMVTSTGIITTIAGTGVYGSSGDGGAATSAQMAYPIGVSVDISGNVYIVDYNKIRIVTSKGIITTFAGTGTRGSSGDGGAATSAQLYSPTGVSVDISGNVYIAVSWNHKIRMVNSTGIITTFAGTGAQGSSGNSNGNGGAATSAQLSTPTGVSVDISGNVYIADTYNHQIREVTSTGIITTIAGGGDGSGGDDDSGAATSAQLNWPIAVSVDISGNVYIADGDKIQRVAPRGSTAGTVVDRETFVECPAGLKISGVRFCNGWTSYGSPNSIQSGTSVVYGVRIVNSTTVSTGISPSYPAGLQSAVYFNRTRGSRGTWDVSMNKTYSGVTAFTQYYLQFWSTRQNASVAATFTVSLGGRVVYATAPQVNVWTQATTASVCAPSSLLVAQFRATADGVHSAMAVAGISLVAGAGCTTQSPSPQPSPTPTTQVERTNITIYTPLNMI